MSYVIRSIEARVDDVRRSDRTIVCRCGTSALDHYRTVIASDGIELGNYRRNPVVLWEHGLDPSRGTLPIGRSTKIEPAIGPKGPELLAATRFGTDEFSNRLFEMYRDGDLRGWSVRVIPIPRYCGPPTSEEIRARPELVDCICCYRRSTLGEYSATAVPGNPEALTADEQRALGRLVARGLTMRPALAARARGGRPGALPPLGGRPAGNARAAVAEVCRMIRTFRL